MGKCQRVYEIQERTGRKLGSLVVKDAGEVPEDLGLSPRDLNQLQMPESAVLCELLNDTVCPSIASTGTQLLVPDGD